jgi:hypothetical protein
MKPRHAAALALVGWYLLTPPLDQDGKVDWSAPYSQWMHLASYDTAEKCERERALFGASTGKEVGVPEGQQRQFHQSFVNARCISSEDPGLGNQATRHFKLRHSNSN